MSWASLQCLRKFGVSKNFMHNRGYHKFPSKVFCLTVPKISVGEFFTVAIFSGIEKVWIRGGGEYRDFQSKFLFHCTKIFHWRTLWCFRKTLLSKIFMHRRGGITVLSEFFVSQDRNEKLCIGTLLFSETFWYRKKLMDKRGHITIFSRKFLCLTVPKTFVRESYCFWGNFWFQKVLWMKRGVSRFSVENFWSHSAEKFRGHPSNVSENLGYRKILCIIGGITSFRRKFFVSQCRKMSWACLQCFRKFGVSKNFMHNRGYHKFPSKIFRLTVPKNVVGIPSMAQKIWGIEKFYA